MGMAWILPGIQTAAADKRDPPAPELRLEAHASDFIWNEPILVTVLLAHGGGSLPAVPQRSGELWFEWNPVLTARPGAKPLPLQALPGLGVHRRVFDLLEWYQVPDAGGTWTVAAVYNHAGTILRSSPIKVTVRKPSATEADAEAAARLHHIPWSNYETDKFCGDTFDLVDKWPESRLAKYAHYWNGRYLQNQKDYEKAAASFRKAAQYDGFALKEDAERGLADCLRVPPSAPAAARGPAAP
jgi:hypothetical protein